MQLHEWALGLAAWRKSHNEEGGEVNASPFHVPVFVVTHHAREPLAKQGGTTFEFVTDGIRPALERARAAAGGKDVSISGGASVAQQYLAAGLVDEIRIHLVPVAGRRRQAVRGAR